MLHTLLLLVALPASRADVAPLVARARCQAWLGRTVESIEGERVKFLVRGGLGPRGILSTSYPLPTAEALAHARRQGVFYWGHGVSVQPSVEAARAHDAGLEASAQVTYVIAPGVDLAGLEDTVTVDQRQTAPEVLEDRRQRARLRWAAVFAGGARAIVDFPEPGSRAVRVLDADDARRLFHADEMEFLDGDARGPLFYQRGWFFPPRRGLLRAARLMSRTPRGGLEYQTTKDALKFAAELVDAGWTFSVNTDFVEVLERARLVTHNLGALAAGEPPVPNSWFRDPAMFVATLASHHRGDTFSFELRDPAGTLWAATIGSFGDGRHVMTDTSFAVSPVKKERMAHLKLIGVASTLWLAENGYPEVDKQVITGFTAELKATYEPGRVILDAIRAPKPPASALTRFWRPPPWTTGVDGARVYPHYGRLSTQRTDQ